jgi:hypothetical protein
MYMGVVARPRDDQNFDGKILLLRVSREKQLLRATGSERFVSDATMNGLIREGEWRHCCTDGMTVGELRATVVENYDMDDTVADHLCFGYDTYVGNNGNVKRTWLEDDDVINELEYRPTVENEKVPLDINCLVIQVRHEAGEYVEEDVNCDSQFMLGNIRKVGDAIRDKFSWVPRGDKKYLVMDNAGGHGTEAAIAEYTKILLDEYNIEIIHQCPRSPETNVLDLGIWCSLQWAVDKLMRGKRGDMEALDQGVREVWNNSPELSTAFGNVWTRLGRVLQLIVEDSGGNELVEKKRGKRWAALDEAIPAAATGTSGTDGEDGNLPSSLGITASLQEIIDILEDDDDDDDDDDEF